jgi:hypothetical protein
MINYYKTLGLENGASLSDIEASYNKLSKELDPANNDNLDFFAEEYQKIQEAYTALTGKKPEEKENSSNLNTDKEVSPLTEEKEPITPLNKKPPKKSNKTLLLILAFVIFFIGAPYIYFLIKVSAFKNEIPRLVDQSEYNQNNSKKIWEAKFFENHPEIVKQHLTDGTNKGFNFKESDRKYTKDSIINFFIYSETIPLVLYKPDFFQCVYYDAVNFDAYWNHYTVSLGKAKGNGKPLPPYLEMLKRTKKKHRVSNKEFEELIQMVGGLKSFHQEKPSSTDDTCKKCIENYQTAFETNTVAIVDFYAFVDQYLGTKKRIGKYNRGILEKYNSKYKIQTAGMNSSMRSKLKLKIKEKPLLTSNELTEVFSGFKEGLGDISYTIEKYNDDLSSLKDYVNETYASYYSTNSLYTGATPYSYCYGKTPYCSPPNEYAECSYIDIKASSNSDVVVIVKKNNRVYSHAYIKAGGYYKFKVGNGSFQTFFYYGKGWNPNKYIKNGSCGKITGGFVSNESLDKSDVIRLNNSSMSFTLYAVENGNFKPKASNKNEAF